VTNLADEMNVPPRRRITIPDASYAIVVSSELLQEVKALCFLLRGQRRIPTELRNGMTSIAGDLLLAIVEAEHEQK
jgi:hypothetical protein